ncbi:hypothetical protein [Bacillus marinisedimentorum]|uniref:hypothetical protein n=1 Tax=Bacillus marinisedimentorum TaxID=1821260 RepID=UPI0008720021|nr:hypothetical protein [Bacillus marinisedimentorum]
MGISLLLAAAGWVSLYMAGSWLPAAGVPLPELLTTLILNPFRFLAAMTAFAAGFICHGEAIKWAVMQLIHKKSKRHVRLKGALIAQFIIIGYYFMLHTRLWVTCFFIGFAVLYGMISLKEGSRETQPQQ